MRTVRMVIALCLAGIAGVFAWIYWPAARDDDPQRAKLRQAVIETAAAFRAWPCNEALERKYLEAAAAYARAFAVLGGCPDFPACRPDSAGMMRNAERIFATSADATVHAAMRAVHDMGVRLKDYPGGLGLAVEHLSGSVARREGVFLCTRVAAAGPRVAAAAADAVNAAPDAKAAAPHVNYIPMGGLTTSVPASAARPPTRPELEREARNHFRDVALQALRRPGPALCGATERGNFLAAMNQYYTQRDLALHGTAARSRAEQAEVERAWSTPADLQVDGIVREYVTEGYLRAGDLQRLETVDRLLVGIKPRHYVCADAGKS